MSKIVVPFIIFILFFSIIITSAMANDYDVIYNMVNGDGNKVDSIKIGDTWALVSVSYVECGGMVLLHYIDGEWRIVAKGGGAMGHTELYIYGVPNKTRFKILGYKPSSEEMERLKETSSKPYWIGLASEQLLTEDNLKHQNFWTLTLMRNEIYGKYGRIFQDKELKGYFESRPWYEKNPKYNDNMLTKIEKRNADFILEYQEKHNLLY